MSDPTLKSMLHALAPLDDVESFQRKVNRDRRWREEQQELDEEIDAIERMDAEQFFEDQQAPQGDRR